MDVCVIDIIQTFMYRRPWPVGTHWPATCDVCGHVLPGQMHKLQRAAHADGWTFSLRTVNRMFSFAAFFTARVTQCVIRYDHLAMKLGLMSRSGNLISGYGLRFLACMCAVAHSYNAAANRRPICGQFSTVPEPTGSGPNQIQY